MRSHFDVIVIGAGPAGTAAAYPLAQRGYSVLLVDRCCFPRRKPCGGGLSVKTLRLLPYSIGSIIEHSTNVLGVGILGKHGHYYELFQGRGLICAFVQRESFDALNLQQARLAGAEFRQVEKLARIEEADDYVRIVTDAGALTCTFLIGADGANSTVRRLTKTPGSFSYGFAIEGEVDYRYVQHDVVAEFYFGQIDHGYGWLFPKKDHVNVGIYVCRPDPNLSKTRLLRYSQDRLGTTKLNRVAGWPVCFQGARELSLTRRVLLVGDAAGLVEPLSGEGIHNAIKSGRAAAEAIMLANGNSASVVNQAYEMRIRSILKDNRRCQGIGRLFYAHLDLASFAMRNLPIRRSWLMRGFIAGGTTREITNRLFIYPAKPDVQAANANGEHGAD